MISIVTYAASSAELLATWRTLPQSDDFEWLVGTPYGLSIPTGLLADARCRILQDSQSPNLVLRAILAQAQGEAILPVHGGVRFLPRESFGRLLAGNPRGGCCALGWAPMKDATKIDESHKEAAGWRWTTVDKDQVRRRHLEPFGSPAAFADPNFASPFCLIDQEYAKAANFSDTADARTFNNRILNFDLALRAISAGAEMRHTSVFTLGEALPLARHERAAMEVLGQRSTSPDRADSIVANWVANAGTIELRRLYLTAYQSEHPVMETLCGMPIDLSGVANDSVGEILVENYLPFLPGQAAAGFLEECYRILCQGGWLRLRAPSAQGPHAWANPLYRSWWNATTFLICTQHQNAAAAGRKTYRFYGHRIWNGVVKDQLIAAADLVAIKRPHAHHGVMEI